MGAQGILWRSSGYDLELSLPCQWTQSLVRELKFHSPGDVVKKQRKFGYTRRHGASLRVAVTLKVIIRKTKAVETLINTKYYSEF